MPGTQFMGCARHATQPFYDDHHHHGLNRKMATPFVANWLLPRDQKKKPLVSPSQTALN
jgi:hypothetical protein